jgi:Helix-turn-helix domain
MAIDILTAQQLGDLLNLPESRVILLARRGDIPCFRVDGRIRFDADEIKDWIERLKTPDAQPRRVEA